MAKKIKCEGDHTSISDAESLEELAEVMAKFPDLHFIHLADAYSTEDEAKKAIKGAARKKAREVAGAFCAARPCATGKCVWSDVDYFYNAWQSSLDKEWTVVLTIKSISCKCKS